MQRGEIRWYTFALPDKRRPRPSALGLAVAAVVLLAVVAACSAENANVQTVPIVDAAVEHRMAPAQGAATISLSNPDSATVQGGTCAVPHTATAPIMTAGSARTTSTSKGTIAIDGKNGNSVACRVVPAGAKYDVTARIRSTMSDNQGTRSVDMAVSVTIGAAESDIPGTLSVMDDDTGQIAYTSSAAHPCRFSIAMGIGPGRVWLSVTCARITDLADADGNACKVDQGYLVFENCVPGS